MNWKKIEPAYDVEAREMGCILQMCQLVLKVWEVEGSLNRKFIQETDIDYHPKSFRSLFMNDKKPESRISDYG